MSSDKNQYENPLVTRYASRRMSRLFSPQFKFSTWRRLWHALAQSQQELGLPISEAQTEAMGRHLDDIDFKVAAEQELRTRHDVMSHIQTFAMAAPEAAPVIHLGATSAYVGDNTDIIQMRSALDLLQSRLLAVIQNLALFAGEQRYQPALGYTHYQPAQLTTVGKRATLWLRDLELDFHDGQYLRGTLLLRGAKGTTGSQASYLELFHGDTARVLELDRLVAEQMGFQGVEPVTGQTYSRKQDDRVMNWLGGIAQSAHRLTNDIRLLQHHRELEEPFGREQVGSSAMPYKRNPMRSERVASLARFVISLGSSTAFTAATQWLERTLDDSANKRLAVPQAFLAVDAILILLTNITAGLQVNPAIIARRLREELPFIATENILMRAVEAGGDRQQLHELIRSHAMAAVGVIRAGGDNDLLERLAADSAFPLVAADLQDLLNPADYIGMAPLQVQNYLEQQIQPLLDANSDLLNLDAEEIRV